MSVSSINNLGSTPLTGAVVLAGTGQLSSSQIGQQISIGIGTLQAVKSLNGATQDLAIVPQNGMGTIVYDEQGGLLLNPYSPATGTATSGTMVGQNMPTLAWTAGSYVPGAVVIGTDTKTYVCVAPSSNAPPTAGEWVAIGGSGGSSTSISNGTAPNIGTVAVGTDGNITLTNGTGGGEISLGDVSTTDPTSTIINIGSRSTLAMLNSGTEDSANIKFSTSQDNSTAVSLNTNAITGYSPPDGQTSLLCVQGENGGSANAYGDFGAGSFQVLGANVDTLNPPAGGTVPSIGANIVLDAGTQVGQVLTLNAGGVGVADFATTIGLLADNVEVPPTSGINMLNGGTDDSAGIRFYTVQDNSAFNTLNTSVGVVGYTAPGTQTSLLCVQGLGGSNPSDYGDLGVGSLQVLGNTALAPDTADGGTLPFITASEGTGTQTLTLNAGGSGIAGFATNVDIVADNLTLNGNPLNAGGITTLVGGTGSATGASVTIGTNLTASGSSTTFNATATGSTLTLNLNIPPTTNNMNYIIAGWDETTGYAVGSVVLYGTLSYVCIVAVPPALSGVGATPNQPPPLAPGFWECLGASTSTTWRGDWSATSLYAVGALVAYEGVYYINLTTVEGTIGTPAPPPPNENWLLFQNQTTPVVPTADTGVPVWDNATVYKAGQLVYYQIPATQPGSNPTTDPAQPPPLSAQLFICCVGLSTAGVIPNTVPATGDIPEWALVGSQQTMSWAGQWTNAQAYSIGQLVEQVGGTIPGIYVAIAPSPQEIPGSGTTNAYPSITPSRWAPIAITAGSSTTNAVYNASAYSATNPYPAQTILTDPTWGTFGAITDVPASTANTEPWYPSSTYWKGVSYGYAIYKGTTFDDTGNTPYPIGTMLYLAGGLYICNLAYAVPSTVIPILLETYFTVIAPAPKQVDGAGVLFTPMSYSNTLIASLPVLLVADTPSPNTINIDGSNGINGSIIDLTLIPNRQYFLQYNFQLLLPHPMNNANNWGTGGIQYQFYFQYNATPSTVGSPLQPFYTLVLDEVATQPTTITIAGTMAFVAPSDATYLGIAIVSTVGTGGTAWAYGTAGDPNTPILFQTANPIVVDTFSAIQNANPNINTYGFQNCFLLTAPFVGGN